jgi:hypothetical protein
MELEVKRKLRQAKDTISDYFINGNWFCNTLEDFDRGLTDAMTVEQILAIKVAGDTAVPTGRYELILDYSNKFGRIMPHITNVKGFVGIRQHAGNTDKDVEGCQAVGVYNGQEDFISDSKTTFDVLMDILTRADARREKMWITITSNYNEPLYPHQ